MTIDGSHEGYEAVRQFLNQLHNNAGDWAREGAVIDARKALERLLNDARGECLAKDAEIARLRADNAAWHVAANKAAEMLAVMHPARVPLLEACRDGNPGAALLEEMRKDKETLRDLAGVLREISDVGFHQTDRMQALDVLKKHGLL